MMIMMVMKIMKMKIVPKMMIMMALAMMIMTMMNIKAHYYSMVNLRDDYILEHVVEFPVT